MPIGFPDTATFDVSNTTSISVSVVTEIGTIVFDPSASAYTLTGTNFKIGVITNNSGISQTFSCSTTLEGAATGPNSFVGNLTLLEGHGNAGVSSFTGNVVLFADVTDVANAEVTPTGQIEFSEFATAGNAMITNNGATVAGGHAVTTKFFEEGQPGNATIINNGGTITGAEGGATIFSVLGIPPFTGTLIANGGTNGGGGGRILLQASHFNGGTGRAVVNAGASLDASGMVDPNGASMGSIEGAGDFFLSNSAAPFKVGANNLSTTVAGVIHDGGGFPSRGGLLTKTGSGTLTLTNANSYSAGTIIESGAMLALSAGALGSGDVSLTTAGTTLRLHDDTGVTGSIGSSAALSVVSGSTVNLDFTGIRPIASLVVDGVIQAPGIYGSATSGAPNQIPEFTGNGLLLVTGPTVASRKSHGGNTFDLFVSRGGLPTVEPRSGGLSNTYQLVISLSQPGHA